MGTKIEPLVGAELDRKLEQLEAQARTWVDLDLSGNHKLWQETHVALREDVSRLVATIRDLQRDRELIIKERDAARALVKELRAV